MEYNQLPFGEFRLVIPMTVEMTQLITSEQMKTTVEALNALQVEYDKVTSITIPLT